MIGRPKGSTNRQSKAIKDMITAALDEAGGIEYFVRQSKENPTAFMSLIGKTLPLALSNDDENKFQIEVTMNVKGRPDNTPSVLPPTGTEAV